MVGWHSINDYKKIIVVQPFRKATGYCNSSPQSHGNIFIFAILYLLFMLVTPDLYCVLTQLRLSSNSCSANIIVSDI